MQRRDLFKYTLVAAAAGFAARPAAALDTIMPAAKTVPDARLTAPLTLPASGEIKVAFLISPDAEVVDFAGPWGVFEFVSVGEEGRNPFKLVTVAASRAPVKVSGGMTLLPDHSFADAPMPDVVVVPALDTEALAPAALDWLRTVSQSAALTMSVCNGSYVLAEAGLLDGKTATAHHSAYGMLRVLYPRVKVVRGLRYVEDGRIATSGGLTSGIDLALRVVERYFGRAVAKKTALDLEYQGTGWMQPASNARFAKKPVGTAERPVCPVCEAQMARQSALPAQFKGKTHYFCSDYCKTHFFAAPERFLGRQ